MFELRNTGGPTGYLFNIHEFLKKEPNNQVVFLSELIKPEEDIIQHDLNQVKKNTSNQINNNKTKKIRNLWHIILRILDNSPNLKDFITKTVDYIYRVYHIRWTGKESKLELNEFDFIHFHFLIHLAQFKNTYPNFTGKTILTSHCPCPWTDEIIASEKTLRFVRRIMIKQECKIYRKSDYLMFPCPQAKEPYEHDKSIKKVLEQKKKQTFYVPTSIIASSVQGDRVSFCKENNIPLDAFIIVYCGRHNSIKGYDILKEIAIQTLDKLPNLFFVCAGTGNIQPLLHPRWIELGFISNVQEVMSMGDLYVLPNRETYFDLVAIEVLRAGLVLSLSDTGGNKYYHTLPKEETQGITFFDFKDLKTITNQIHWLYDMKNNNFAAYNHLKASNIELYNKYFTTDRYIEAYTNAINQL